MKFIKFFMVFIIILLGLSFCTTSFASQVSLSYNDSLKENSVFNVSIDITPDDNKNVYFIEGQLDYDKSVFNEIEEKNLNPFDNWSGLVFNSDNKKFIIEGGNNPLQDKTGVMNIAFYTKKNIKTDSTTISLKNIKILDDENVDKNLEDASINIVIHNQDGSVKQDSKNTASSLSRLPFAGVPAFVSIFIVIGIIVFAVLVYLRKKRYS